MNTHQNQVLQGGYNQGLMSAGTSADVMRAAEVLVRSRTPYGMCPSLNEIERVAREIEKILPHY